MNYLIPIAGLAVLAVGILLSSLAKAAARGNQAEWDMDETFRDLQDVQTFKQNLTQDMIDEMEMRTRIIEDLPEIAIHKSYKALKSFRDDLEPLSRAMMSELEAGGRVAVHLGPVVYIIGLEEKEKAATPQLVREALV